MIYISYYSGHTVRGGGVDGGRGRGAGFSLLGRLSGPLLALPCVGHRHTHAHP